MSESVFSLYRLATTLRPMKLIRYRTTSMDPQLENLLDANQNLKCSNRFEFGELLGQGAFGRVHTASLDNGRTFDLAVKVPGSQRPYEDLLPELKTLLEIGDHRAIVSLQSFFLEKPHIALFFERGACSLRDLLQFRTLDRNELRYLYIQMRDALEWCHGRMFCHCDIKPDNIIVYFNGDAKLGDFGIASRINESGYLENPDSGTVQYKCPESLEKPKRQGDIWLVTSAKDHWALAITICEVCVGSTPFAGNDEEQILTAIKLGHFYKHIDNNQGWKTCSTLTYFYSHFYCRPVSQDSSFLRDSYFAYKPVKNLGDLLNYCVERQRTAEPGRDEEWCKLF